MNKHATTYLAIALVVLALIAAAILMKSSHFSILDYLIKLHGG